MKLSEEMYNMALQSEGICTIYDDNYVLLKKKMPVTDDKLSWYIETIRSLKEKGISLATIKDYALVPGTTSSFNDGKTQYTTGIFLEERAKGVSLTHDVVYLKPGIDYDFNAVVSDYLKLSVSYIEELELRASAKQEVFDKLVGDCYSILQSGLTIDPKPLNFFFAKDSGFTIIDVISANEYSITNFTTFFPKSMFGIVFGFGRPYISIGLQNILVLPSELNHRIMEAGQILEDKIAIALKKYGFSNELVLEAIKINKFRYENQDGTVELDVMEEYIANQYLEISKKEEAKKKSRSSEDNFLLSW